MANRIKGITVEIGGDTTKLSKALEGVNKNIRNIISKEDFEKIQLIIQKHIEERNIVKDIGKYKQQALWISQCEKHHTGIHSLFIGNGQQKPGRIIGNRR